MCTDKLNFWDCQGQTKSSVKFSENHQQINNADSFIFDRCVFYEQHMSCCKSDLIQKNTSMIYHEFFLRIVIGSNRRKEFKIFD